MELHRSGSLRAIPDEDAGSCVREESMRFIEASSPELILDDLRIEGEGQAIHSLQVMERSHILITLEQVN